MDHGPPPHDGRDQIYHHDKYVYDFNHHTVYAHAPYTHTLYAHALPLGATGFLQ